MNEGADEDDTVSELEAGQTLFELLMDASHDIGARIVCSACISFLSLVISKSSLDPATRDGAIEAIGLDIRNGFDVYDKVTREGLN